MNDKSLKKSIFLFFGFSYLITWMYILPNALYSHNLLPFEMPKLFSVLAAYGPALAALIVAGIIYGKKEIFNVLKKITVRKVNYKWYIIAIFFQPLLIILSLGIYKLFGERVSFSDAPIYSLGQGITNKNIFLMIIPYFIIQGISVLGEEIGWRGFGVLELLKKSNWLLTSLILGILWSLWHLPLLLTNGAPQSQFPMTLYFIDLIITTFIFTWLLLKTKESILIVTIYHASINTFTIFLPIIPIGNSSQTPFILLIIFKAIFVFGLLFKYKNKIA